jgi:hypothetical protein
VSVLAAAHRPIVTVAAEHGAGGDLVAPRVAEALGVPFLDRMLPASLIGAAEEAERPSGLVGRLARASSMLAGEPVERIDSDEGHMRAELAELAASVPNGFSSTNRVPLGRSARVSAVHARTVIDGGSAK